MTTLLETFLPRTLTDSLEPVPMSYAEVAHIARVLSAIRAAVESRHLLTLDCALNIFELAVRGR
jgi:hypothetical protein